MESCKNIIEQKDGYKTILYHFQSVEEPKASILILHGMAEHHKRYYSFANFLNSHDIDVYLYDHRGHGTETLINDLGFYDNSKGYKIVIEDAIEVLQHINKNKRSDKLFLMGHSMGSLIARNVIQAYDKIDGVILSGTTFPNKIKTYPGLLLASLIKLINGPKHRSPFLNSMMFGGKAYTKLISRTSFDWLSRCNSSVGAYIHDPYCGFICTISFYRDVIKLAALASNTSFMKQTRTNLPILLVSGDHDPVGGYGKEVTHLAATYKKLGFSNITSKLYEECRHELLQELNPDEVMKDIYSWINQQF